MDELNKIINDPILLAEIGIVATIIIIQIVVFSRNNAAIRTLRKIYPSATALEAKETALPPEEQDGKEGTALQIVSTKRFSNTFKDIVRTTNAYLRKNRGLAEADILREMAEDKDSAVEKAIDANISLPLYIGLLCTFTGVIIGLIKVMTVGVTDAAIQSFVGGVLIGMIGSAIGLALTVRSNFLFKDSKKQRDADRYEYLSFVRGQILPALKEEVEVEVVQDESVDEIREKLAAFHHGFANYQEYMNDSLGETLRLFNELKGVFDRIRQLEGGLASVGHVIENNDNMLEKQVAYIDAYAQKAEQFTQILGEHYAQVDGKLNTIVNEGVRKIDTGIQAAYAKMDQYLEGLENGENSKAFVDGLQQNLTVIRGDLAHLQSRSAEINDKILKRLESDGQINLRISQQMEAMNANLKQVLLDQQKMRGSFINSTAFKIFAITGTVAFVLAIAGGIAYAVTTYMTP